MPERLSPFLFFDMVPAFRVQNQGNFISGNYPGILIKIKQIEAKTKNRQKCRKKEDFSLFLKMNMVPGTGLEPVERRF